MSGGREAPAGSFNGAEASVNLADLAHTSSLGGRLEELRGRTVLIVTRSQLAAAIAMIELDGVARRMVLCPPDLSREHLPGVVDCAGADAWVRDSDVPESDVAGIRTCVLADPRSLEPGVTRACSHETEWILLTSGTTGAPKLVLHTLAGLTSAIRRQTPSADTPVWSTFYDIRRYGGLQIFMRGALRGCLVLSHPAEALSDYLSRAANAGITHISGTPSHWRRALMSGIASRISPRYVRLSGEIADQGILDNLRAAYPRASVAHAFASTEAGVAFEVGDGLAGFPATLLGAVGTGVDLKVDEETLRIRSPGNAIRYLGENVPAIRGADGFVDTGDRIEVRAGRCHFAGRIGGVINVGGLKVHPEEVEAVINSHPWVHMSRVKARRNPITGAVVSAEVVLADHAGDRSERPAADTLKREITETCRHGLATHKVPAMITFVDSLEVSASGKLVRPNA